MSKINLIIKRLLLSLKASNEGWLEDIRDQIFDPKYLDSGDVDGPESLLPYKDPDTEEEIYEELAISKQSWLDLLTRGDVMYTYKDVGGNSGITAYDSGVDWFMIRFKDGSLYLYTKQSTTPERIEYMRELALQGKGLNSYVTRIVGKNYAGRNYKGAVTMLPGMESLNNSKTYRALQLVLAYENTIMSKTVAQEKFEELKTKSGKDGLEPNAQKALKIAEALLDKSTLKK